MKMSCATFVEPKYLMQADECDENESHFHLLHDCSFSSPVYTSTVYRGGSWLVQ